MVFLAVPVVAAQAPLRRTVPLERPTKVSMVEKAWLVARFLRAVAVAVVLLVNHHPARLEVPVVAV
jgi:hypothetical protein